MDRYADKIPEVLHAPINKLGERLTIRLDELDEIIQHYIIQLVLDKFNKFFNGLGNPLNDDGDVELNMHIWRSGLCDLNVKQILDGLYLVLTGNTEYQKYPPSSPMAFYSVCKSISFYSSNEEESIKLRARIDANISKRSTDEYAAKFWSEIRKMTKASRPSYRDGA
jgi:flagellar hook-associated protein FlgK